MPCPTTGDNQIKFYRHAPIPHLKLSNTETYVHMLPVADRLRICHPCPFEGHDFRENELRWRLGKDHICEEHERRRILPR